MKLNNSDSIIRGWENKAKKEKFGGIFTSILETHLGRDADTRGGADTGMEQELIEQE